jgi:hypothetical protein
MTIFLDGNGQRVKLPNGKFKCVSHIVTPGGAPPEGKDLFKKLTSIATYLDHPLQQHCNAHFGSPSHQCTACVSSAHKLLLQSLLFYWSLQRFREETSTSDSNEDEEFVTAFREITEEECAAVQEVEALYVSVAKYSRYEAQLSHIQATWIHYMRKKVQVPLLKKSVQVLSYQDCPQVATTYKDFKAYWIPCILTNCSGDLNKCRSHRLKLVEAHSPGQTIESVSSEDCRKRITLCFCRISTCSKSCQSRPASGRW